ncbi:MAG: hypothetical protein QME07_00150 [bacterium]|nr:hypothetical protein [bacterium]
MKRKFFLLGLFSTLVFAETLLLPDIEKRLAKDEGLFLLPEQRVIIKQVERAVQKKTNPLFSMRNDGGGLFPSEQKEEKETIILPAVPSYSLSSPPLSFSYPSFSEVKKEIEGESKKESLELRSELEKEKKEEVLPEPPLEKVAKTAEEPQPEIPPLRTERVEIPPLEKVVSAEIEKELDRFSVDNELVREAEKLLVERETLKKEEMKDLEPELELAHQKEEKPEAKAEPPKEPEKAKVIPPKVEIAKIPEVIPPKEPEIRPPISMEALTVKATERTKETEKRIETLAYLPSNLQELKTTPGDWAKWRLPEESELTVLGRKFIKMDYNGKNYLNTKEKGKTSNQLNIAQELDVSIKGVVKKKVTVNIDYSDKSTDLADPKKTFEVKYAGEKGEVIQEVNFGDVALEIPGTRFVSYKKSGFGINGKAQFLKNKLGLTAIASREKGESRSKEWTGTQSLVLKDIPVTNYISRRYYQLLAEIPLGTETTEGGRIEYLKAKGYLPIKPGSVKVYIDDQIGDNNYTAEQFTAYTYNHAGSHTGWFDLQYPGDDYTLDYNTGIISIRNSFKDNDVVCLSFIDGKGSLTTNLIIKEDKIEETNHPEWYNLFEIKGYYSLGYGKINPDEANFSLEIKDANGKSWYDADGDGLKDTDEIPYVRLFGLDRETRYDQYGNERPGYGKIDKEFIDQDSGMLKFPDRLPFDFGTTGAKYANRFYIEDTIIAGILSQFSNLLPTLSNPDCYKQTSPSSKYSIHINYPRESMLFTLNELNIVPDSERVYLNGNRLSKPDYRLDYEVGHLTIYRKIAKSDKIRIDYEYAPFLGVYQKSLFGSRLTYAPHKDISLGSTFIGETGAGLKGAPSVTHPSTSLSVFDLNTKVNLINLLKERAGDRSLPLNSLSVEAEMARSTQNPNTYGYGMIDSMDDLEGERTIAINEDSWLLSGISREGKIFYTDSGKQTPFSERAGPYNKDGGHRSDEDQNKQKMLCFELELGTDSSLSEVQSISKDGEDLSEYSHLQVWANAPASSTVKLYIDLGKASEDFDNDGILDTEDINKDGYLNPGEDIGFSFGTLTKVGKSNGKLDTEDLNGNGILDTDQNLSGILVNDEKYYIKTINTAQGWKLYSIPLTDISTSTDFWKVIKDIRLKFKTEAGATYNGSIYIDQIAITGASWEKPMFLKGTGTAILEGKNSKDDADYDFPKDTEEYKNLHKNEKIEKDGLLFLKIEPSTATTLSIRKKLGRFHNYWSYGRLRFWAKSSVGSSSLAFQFGLDNANYFKFTCGTLSSQWKLITLDLARFKEMLAKKQKGTETDQYYILGSPNLGMVKELMFVVESAESDEVWINELHLSEVIERDGEAYFFSVSGGNNKWGSFNMNRSEKSGSFRTLGPASSGEETQSEHFDGKITRIPALTDLSYTYDRSKGNLTFQNVDEVSNQSFGNMLKKDQLVKMSFNPNKIKDKGFPTLYSSWKKNEASYKYEANNNDLVNHEITGGLAYGHTLWKGAKTKAIGLTTNYDYIQKNGTFSNYLDTSTTKKEEATSHSLKNTLTIVPKEYLAGSNISFGGGRRTGRLKYPERTGSATTQEEREATDGAFGLNLKFYPKSPISKRFLGSSSFSSEYSGKLNLSNEDVVYKDCLGTTTNEGLKTEGISNGLIITLSPIKSLTNKYEITDIKNESKSNLAKNTWRTGSCNQANNLTYNIVKGEWLSAESRLYGAQQEAKLKEDASLRLTNRNLKLELNKGFFYPNKTRFKKVKYLNSINSINIDQRFNFNENYCFKTNREPEKKTANMDTYFSLIENFSKLSWKNYGLTPSCGFSLGANAGYDNLPFDEATLVTLANIYEDYYQGLLWKRRGGEGDLYKLAKRTSSSNERKFWINSDWFLYKPMTTNSKFTYTLKETNSLSRADSICQEINNTLNLLSAKPCLTNKFKASEAKANYKIDWSHNYTLSEEQNKTTTHSPYFEWSATWQRPLTTKAILSTTYTKLEERLGVVTNSISIDPSSSFAYDFTKPGFLRVPFTNKKIDLERKLVLNGGLNMSFKRTTKKIPGQKDRKDLNTDYLKLNLSGTYNVQKNLKGTLGANLEYFKDRVLDGKDYIGYGSYVSIEFKF